MNKFLTDVRDYIYMLAFYNRNVQYWIYCFAIVFFHYLGLFLLLGIFIPDWLFLYIAKTRQYPFIIQVVNCIVLTAPALLLALGFDYLLINNPLPLKDEITPKVFRRKLLNTYLFLFSGLVFTILFGYLFLKFRSGR